MKRILSGINPSSASGLHLGNYFGAVKQQITYQNTDECFYFVANLHSLNSVFDPKIISSNTQNIFLEYIALGIDPEKSTFYVESDIPEITYLQTILNNAVTVSELKRMHAYKDKLVNENESNDAISMGLFSYPVLMAADILLFDADVIPVGEDQAQHVEICREIARTFNNRYGEVLKIPELSINKQTSRILGTDGVRKMSKSLGNDISIFADEKVIEKQIMSTVTDPARIHPTDPGDPVKNISFTYLKVLEYDENKLNDMVDRYKKGTIGDVEIKKILLNHFIEYFQEPRNKKKELEKNIHKLQEIREVGRVKAQKVASEVYNRVTSAIGISI